MTKGMRFRKGVAALGVLALVALMAGYGCRGDEPAAPSPTAATEMPTPTALPPAPAQKPPLDIGAFDLFSGGPGGSAADGDVDVASVEDVLEKGLRLAEVSPVHIAFRGTADTSSVRCAWRGVARTPEQREAAIRFWLDLDDDHPLPSPADAERRFIAELDRINAVYPATLVSNFRAIARGGLSTDYVFLTCYADYTVREYLLGSGPTGTTKLSVTYDRMGEARSYDLYRLAHEAGEFGSEALMTEAEYADWRSQVVFDVELALSIILEGRESVVFLAPMGAHNAIAIEAWQVVAQWDLQTDEDDTVNAVRFGAPQGDSEHTQTLANLKSRITTATTATSTSATMPTRITNASGLTQYYRDIGASGDITRDDGDPATFTPAQPPPIPTCLGSAAVADPRLHPGLVRDCTILLDSMDTLRGTAALDWSAATTTATWEGITLDASSTRVTALELDAEELDGTIPLALGGLSALTTLDLSGNRLTGEIPAELGRLWSLEELRLSGNRLTGCIPIALEDVATNDLSLLGLPYC